MTLLEWALTYAHRGWPVFPCHPRTKRPMVRGDIDAQTGKEIEGTGGVKKATTDPDTIKAWWNRWPEAMIGLATGRAAGLFVVDFDAGTDDKTGEIFETADLVAALEQELGATLPRAGRWEVATPRGGCHHYFRWPENAADAVGNRGGLIKRVDVRGEGGYVILPPSRRPDGKHYAWLTKPKPDEMQAAEAPAALLDCILRRGRWAERRPTAQQHDGAQASSANVIALDAAVRRYVLAALDAEAEAVAQSPAGARNDRLNIAALKLGGYVAAAALREAQVREALEDAAQRCRLVQDDGWRSVRATIDSGLTKGLQTPADLTRIRAAAQRRSAAGARSGGAAKGSIASERSSQAGAAETPRAAEGGGGGRRGRDRGHDEPAGDDDGLDLQLAFYPMTDLANAERFVARNRDKLLWCPALGWLWWDGRRWNRDAADEKVKIAEHETVRAIQREAEALKRSGRDVVVGSKGRGDKETAVMMSDLLAAWGRASEAANRLSPIAKRAGPYLVVKPSKLDADPWKINVLNGTLTVRRVRGEGEDCISFGPHDPADRITKLAPVIYDPNATCPRYDEFIAKVQPEATRRRFLHQYNGYSYTGDVSEQVFLFHWGKGKNGKSTLLDTVGFIAGDYGKTMPIETFIDQGRGRNAGQATPDLAMLQGVRFLRASEPEKGAKFAESLLKLALSGEEMPVRELNRPYYMLRPEFKLSMSGNYKPQIHGSDEGIWRRTRLVPWEVTIPEERRDKNLPEKLRAEASGIFNHILDGLRDWVDHGLITPEDVAAATLEYRRQSDPLGRFLEACVRFAPGKRVQSSVMHTLYVAWCKANTTTAWSGKGFSQALIERGYRIKHSNVNWWLDVELTKSPGDFVDHEGNPLSEASVQEEADNDEVVF